MKNNVAIVHDSYLHEGGAEKVLKTFLKIFPEADVYIPLIKPEFKTLIKKDHQLYTSPLSLLPISNKSASLLKPLVFYYWQNLDLSQYSLVISSSHSFSSKSVRTLKHSKHISYIHTSPKYLYDELNQFIWIKKQPFKTLLAPFILYLRKKDLAGAQKPDLLIANSKTVQQRIKKYYHRSSKIIYPPAVDKINQLTKTLSKDNNKKYYLFFSRLESQKGIELVIKTFNKNKQKLLVVGTGSKEKAIKKVAKPNISFLGFLPEKKKRQVYSQAKALIYAAIDEDFGIVPIEAMANGIPVIAYKSGGVSETIINRKTGLFFTQYSSQSLQQAIDGLDSLKIDSKQLQQQATKFSEKRFITQIRQVVKSLN